MIAKRVKKLGANSFRKLSRYVRDLSAEGEKVRASWATNCADDADLDLAEIEIEATQVLNTRTSKDKTYHLVVSLAPGEDLTDDQWRDVETYFCKAIGYSDHQRIAAIHTDTGKIHMHLAISKIHPQKLTAIEPYYDEYKLQDACRDLEKVYGLKLGISPEKNKSRKDVEAFQKIQSFESYVGEKAKEGLKELLKSNGVSWEKVQAELGTHDLEIRERGAGLVISHRNKPLFIKASLIDRDFSKKALESMLGPFQRSTFQGPPRESYSLVPNAKTEVSKKLYAEYSEERAERFEYRTAHRTAQRESLKAKLDDIRERYAEQRHEIKRDRIIARGHKKSVYQKLSLHMKEEISEAYALDKAQREGLRDKAPLTPWKEWIYQKAISGDESALLVLRAGAASTAEAAVDRFCGEPNHKVFEGIEKRLGVTVSSNTEFLKDHLQTTEVQSF